MTLPLAEYHSHRNPSKSQQNESSFAAVSEKTLHIFLPTPDAEYVVLLVERFMAREVRCLGNGQTHTTTTVTLAAHAPPRVNNYIQCTHTH